mgnify:CR=1 FL=1
MGTGQGLDEVARLDEVSAIHAAMQWMDMMTQHLPEAMREGNKIHAAALRRIVCRQFMQVYRRDDSANSQ